MGDPYANAAKQIDKENQVKNEPSLKVKLARSIIENKETVGQIEKYIKSLLAVLALFYMAVSSKEAHESNAPWIPSREILEAFTN